MVHSPTSPAVTPTASPTEVVEETPSRDDEPTCVAEKVEETPTVMPPAIWTFVPPHDLAPELLTPASPSAVHLDPAHPEPASLDTSARATPTDALRTGTIDTPVSGAPISTTGAADLPSTAPPTDPPGSGLPDSHVPEVTVSGATLGFTAAPPTTPITPRSTAATPSGYIIRPRPSIALGRPLPYVRAPAPSQASSSHGRFRLPTAMPSVAPSVALGSATLPVARPSGPVARPSGPVTRPSGPVTGTRVRATAPDPRTQRPKLIPQNEFERHIRRQRDRKNEREVESKMRRAAERANSG